MHPNVYSVPPLLLPSPQSSPSLSTYPSLPSSFVPCLSLPALSSHSHPGASSLPPAYLPSSPFSMSLFLSLIPFLSFLPSSSPSNPREMGTSSINKSAIKVSISKLFDVCESLSVELLHKVVAYPPTLPRPSLSPSLPPSLPLQAFERKPKPASELMASRQLRCIYFFIHCVCI